MEAAEQHTQQLKSEAVIKQVSPANRTVPCKHCGKNNHHTSKCHFKEAICNTYHKKGLVAKICRAQRQQQPAAPKRKFIQTKEPGGLEQSKQQTSELPLYKINNGS